MFSNVRQTFVMVLSLELLSRTGMFRQHWSSDSDYWDYEIYEWRDLADTSKQLFLPRFLNRNYSTISNCWIFN